MKARNILATIAVVSAIAGTTFVGANTVSAQSGGESLVGRLADRFSLSEDEVQEVFDEHKTERRQMREVRHDEHLAGLVEDGTLTEEQRSELEAFGDERHQLRDELRSQDLSKTEIREAMEGLRAEVEAWAEDNNINLDDIRPDKPAGTMQRHEHRHGSGAMEDVDAQ